MEHEVKQNDEIPESPKNQTQQLTVEEITAYIKKQDQLIDALEKETEAFYEKLGVTHGELKEFLEDKSRYSHEAWDMMQNRYKKLKKAIEKVEKPLQKMNTPENLPTDLPKGPWHLFR